MRAMVSIIVFTSACYSQQIDPMESQPKQKSYATSMRSPPAGSVSRERQLDQSAPPLTWERMARGQVNFDATCAACHGLDGDGDSVVAGKMTLRRPPSLYEPRIMALPPERLYDIVSHGYGMMPRFSDHFTVEERWGIVDYVRALHLSRSVPLAEIGADLRQRLGERR